MTTDTERRVPEHPGWQPWWIRCAEYEGQIVWLTDNAHPSQSEYMKRIWKRYGVGRGPFDPCHPECGCGAPHGTGIFESDSLADAEAAFELACERLREGA